MFRKAWLSFASSLWYTSTVHWAPSVYTRHTLTRLHWIWYSVCTVYTGSVRPVYTLATLSLGLGIYVTGNYPGLWSESHNRLVMSFIQPAWPSGWPIEKCRTKTLCCQIPLLVWNRLKPSIVLPWLYSLRSPWGSWSSFHQPYNTWPFKFRHLKWWFGNGVPKGHKNKRIFSRLYYLFLWPIGSASQNRHFRWWNLNGHAFYKHWIIRAIPPQT